jgi:hypothetical protein
VAPLHWTLVALCEVILVSQSAWSNLIAIGELEAHYTMYCKTMRILIREGKMQREVYV